MRIGELPEITGVAYSSKIPLENQFGSTKCASAENLVKSVFHLAATVKTETDITQMFSVSDNDYATVNSATIYRSGRTYELHMTLTTKTDIVRQANGNISIYRTLARLYAKFYPLATVYGTAYINTYGYYGVAYLDNSGYIQIRHLDSTGSQETISAGAVIDLTFIYLR